MNAKLVSTLVAAPLLAMSALAFASQPVQLSAAQMDNVTAGGISGAQALAAAVGSLVATQTLASANVQVVASQTFEATTINDIATLALAQSSSSAQ
ncbi:MAG: hypothetical protein M0T84_17595 [Betaproteobacteria bacterium]|nr:hypothetical protein [Betaproteobacteria bacterium]